MGLAALVNAEGVVVQRIVVDPVKSVGYSPPEGLTMVIETEATGESSPDYTWDGTVFTPPPPSAETKPA